MKKYKLGYTQGTYDMFHIGHLNLLRHAKEQCEKLIVGVNADSLVLQYKHKVPVVSEKNRAEIIKELRCVDDVRICNTLEKTVIWNDLHFDAIFIGDDWKGNDRWLQTEKDLAPLGVDVVYLKHTEGVSSTLLRTKETEKVDE
jgi:glycerol-3-phosphate cytidylyltransferase